MAKDEKKKEEEKEELEEKKASGDEAEGEESAAAEGEGGKKKISKKMLIIIAIAAVLIIGGGAGAAFYFMGSSDKKSEEAGEQGEHKKEETLKNKPVYFSLGDMLVNLNGEGKRPSFLKIKVSLELASEKDIPLMEAIKPRIIDNFQIYLRELRVEDLRGSAGLYRLREELLLRVTEAAQPVRVRDVLFQEVLVQ